MSTTYHVATPDGTRHGQMCAEDITAKIASGELPADTLVWTEGWSDWRPASTLGAPPVPCADWGLYAAMESVYLHRFFTLRGRASRSEYWYCKLGSFTLLFLTALIGIFAESGGSEDAVLTPMLLGLMITFGLIPNITLAVRRLHDVGMSGWWYLLTLLPMGDLFMLVIALLPSGIPNRWGPRADGPAV